jgi:hypothetical protein
MPKPKRKRKQATYFFETLNAFTDVGLRELSRSEGFTYFLLLRDTRPDGTARTSFGSIAERAGISRRQAIRAVQSLVNRGVVEVVKRGGRGIGPSIYCVVLGGYQTFLRSRATEDDAASDRRVTVNGNGSMVT